jgi:hypothetical protein
MTIPHSPEGSQFDPSNLSARQVQDLHRNADSDSSVFAIHHTLGIGQNQSSPGNHLHDGKTSKGLTGYVTNSSPIVVVGSRAGNAALASLLTALATKGIITDSSSA